MASGLITSFLGEGLAASRPADPDVGSAIALYWATDTNEMSAWLENAWVEDILGGGAISLDDLIDVDLTGAATGDVLTKDAGGDWVPAAPGGGTPSGTSFPGSPATDDKFYRTDRRIEYFYDGTRWLSTQLFVQQFAPETGTINGISVGGGSQRVGNPWAGLFDIYVETFQATTLLTNGTTASNYFTLQLQTGDAASLTNLGSALSSQSDTQNARTLHRTTINAVVASTIESLEILFTETGTAQVFAMPSITYRMVG